MKFSLLSSNKVLKLIEIFKVLKNLNDSVSLYCKESEIFIQVMDDSHVSLLNLTIHKEWFDFYEIEEEETISFQTGIIVKILSLYDPPEPKKLSVKEKKELAKQKKAEAASEVVPEEGNEVSFEKTSAMDKLQITLKYKDNIEKCFELPLFDIDSELLEPEKIEGSIEFSIHTKQMDKYMNELLLFGENMEFICVGDNVFMESSGDEGKYRLKLPHDVLDELMIEPDLKLKTKISLKYLSYITKIFCVFKQLSFKIEKDQPIFIEVLEKKEDGVILLHIRYYIAPKIEDYEEEVDFSEFESNDYNQLENEIIN